MDFGWIRTSVLRARYHARVDQLLSQVDGRQPIVVILPGIMGSTLDTSQRDLSALSPGQLPQYFDNAWLDLGEIALVDGLKRLGINPDLTDHYDRLIVPNNEVHVPMLDVKPYRKAIRDLDAAGCGVLVFPYDWRRSVLDAAWFLWDALQRLDSQVRLDRRVVLLGHSMGGLVAKAFLTQYEEQALSWVGAFVTGGTPFWGSSALMQVCFEGHELFNKLYDPKVVRTVVGGMPGTYEMFFTHRNLWSTGRNPEFPDYPISGDAEPYGPPHAFHWPSSTRRSLLKKAGKVVRLLQRPLPAELLDRTYNFRGTGSQTLAQATWDGSRRRYDFQPTDGDDTVATWAARVAMINDNHVQDLPGALHQDMLQQEPLLEQTMRLANQLVTPSISYPALRSEAAPAAPVPDTATLHDLADRLKDDPDQLSVKELSTLAQGFLRL